MAQGQGVSVLARAYLATGDRFYAEAASRALAPMRLTVAEGGVLLRSDGEVWIEEYPGSPAWTGVLNGHVYAMWGLWDAARVFGDKPAAQLFDETEATLRRRLPRYDFYGIWTRYCLPERGPLVLANAHYQVEHVQQMRAMGLLTGNDEYDRWADRWERQLYRRATATMTVFVRAAFLVPAWFMRTRKARGAFPEGQA